MTGYGITLLDIGSTSRFAATRNALAWLVESHSVGAAHPPTLNSIKTRGVYRVTRTVLQPTNVLHVMGHGADGAGIRAEERLGRRTPTFHLDGLAGVLGPDIQFPATDAVLLDACSTFSNAWINGIQALLPRGRSILFIGSTEDITWQKATTYAAPFYLALLQGRAARSATARKQDLMTAHRSALRAYRSITGESAPFRARLLTGA